MKPDEEKPIAPDRINHFVEDDVDAIEIGGKPMSQRIAEQKKKDRLKKPSNDVEKKP